MIPSPPPTSLLVVRARAGAAAERDRLRSASYLARTARKSLMFCSAVLMFSSELAYENRR